MMTSDARRHFQPSFDMMGLEDVAVVCGLEAAGYTLSYLRSAGYTVLELREAYTDEELHADGCTAAELADEECRESGVK